MHLVMPGNSFISVTVLLQYQLLSRPYTLKLYCKSYVQTYGPFIVKGLVSGGDHFEPSSSEKGF